MKCKYDIIGNQDAKDLSYDQLADLLTISPDAYGILYAKTAEQDNFGKQNAVYEKLTELQEAGMRKFMDGRGLVNPGERGKGILEGSADLAVDDKDFTTQTLIDSAFFTDKKGKPLMEVFNLEDYLKSQKIAYEKQGLSKDEIEKRLNILKEKGAKIAKDSYDLHKILLKEQGTFSTNYTLDDTIQATRGTVFEPLAELIHTDVSSKINLEVRGHNAKNSRELNDPSQGRVLKNITVSAPLSNVPGSNVYAHMDYVAVKPDGSLEIFLLKGTHESPSSWDSAKKEKYRNEAALLLQILDANGINPSTVTINLIPVFLRYDEQFNSISEIDVDKAICLSHNKGGFILYEELANARRFIPSAEQTVEVTDESLETVSMQLGALFPDMDVRSEGVKMTAEEYVDKNWVYMTQGVQPDKGWTIHLDDEVFHVDSPEKGKANKEVVKLVQERLESLVDSETGKYSARYIITKILEGRRSGSCNFNDGYLNQFFSQYYAKTIHNIDGTEKYDYDWMVVSNETLTRANIILFKNRHTKQLNVVMISPMNLRQQRKFGRNENILGYHLQDMRAQDNQGHELLRATNGNIEVMRGLFLLNEVLPTLGDDIKLGDIEVVGNLRFGTHGVSYPISLVAPNFVKAKQVLTAKDPTLKIDNNFQNVDNISPVQTLISEYTRILQQNAAIGVDFKNLRDIIFGTGYNEDGQSSEDFDGLIHTAAGISKDSLSIAKSTEVQIERLEELIDKVSKILKDKVGGNALSPNALIEMANDKSEHISLQTACARILISASLALDRLSGNIRVAMSDLSSIDSMFSRPQNMEDSQVRIVSKLLQDAVHAVSSKLDPIISDYNLTCLNYYEKKGYTKFRNWAVGDQVKVFTHLYQDVDEDLLFKNPYDMSNDLDDDDRVFLKKTLFLLNKIRFEETGQFNFTDENDPNLTSFINKHYKEYFYVPLEKASQSTKWSDPKKYFDDFRRRLTQYCQNPLLFFQETYEGLMDDETRKQITADMENLQTINPFRASDIEEGRKRMMRLGKGTYETNIQNIAIDYVFRHLQQQEMNQMLVRTRGILLYLKLTGQREDGDKDAFAKVVNHIDKYLTTSVFKRPIMSQDEQKLVAKVTPLRRMVTTCYIALSPIAACRDTIQGFFSNNIRALTKFRTDIDLKDVMYAYKYVITDGVHSTLDIDLLDKMNAKWLVSNVNIEQQQEGYKTNTTGITNPGNLAYATLRKPDFLNRMVLLIAKFKHDGSLPAYSIEDGKLKYDWRLDKRFDLLAADDKSDMAAYNKQKALKLSLIMALNKENPGLNLPVKVDTDITEGYTNQEIESIKALGDSIYGSYNASTKAMYENTAIGSQFGVFSTWMNGIYDVYFGKRRESSYQFEQRQAEDENGNLLFIAEDGTITTEDTGVPYLKNIPLMVQGVLRTVFKDCLGDLIYNGGKGLKDIWHDPMQQMNLRRALTDFLVALIIWALFKYAITPAYQEHKKNDDGTNIIANAVIEVLYKGSVSAFDEFKGPAPIIEYISDNTNPAAYQWLSRAGNDLYKLCTGKETLGGTIVKAQALPRAFQDTYKMYVKETKNGIQEA